MRDIILGSTQYFKFTSRSFSTGAPTTLSGTPVISVYEENNLTQITAGITLTVDYDAVTGLNDVAVVATAGNGYETGKTYHLVITTGTVGGVSVVGEVVGEFSIEESAAYGIVNHPSYGNAQLVRSATPANTLKVDVNNRAESLLGATTHTGAVVPIVSTVTDGAKSATALSNATWTDAKAALVDAAISGRPTLAQVEASTILAKEATVAARATQASVDGKPTLAQIEGSLVLAKEATVSSRASQTSVDGKPTLAQIEATTVLAKETTLTNRTLLAVNYFDPATDPVLVAESSQDSIVDKLCDEAINPAAHNVPNSLARVVWQSKAAGSYSSFIWVDTLTGSSGTTAGENGTENNPVSLWADALTLNADPETPKNRFHISDGSSIALTSGISNYDIEGEAWSLALGGQSINGAYIKGATVSGIGTVTTTPANFDHCIFSSCTIGNVHAHSSHVDGTISLANTGTYFFGVCHSGLNGGLQPVFSFGAAAAQTLILRGWNGSAELQTMAIGDKADIDGVGKQVIINANCTGGTLTVSGSFDVIDNSGGAVTIIQPSNNTTQISAVNTKIGTPSASVSGDIAAVKAESSSLVKGIIKANAAGKFPIRMADINGDSIASQPVTVTRKIDAGTWAAIAGSGTVTDSEGVSIISYNAADVNGTDTVSFKITAIGARTVYLHFKLSA